MNRAEALARLRAICEKAEGCPVPQDDCECESTEECPLGIILATETFPNPVNRP
jgi:hypothetical protein